MTDDAAAAPAAQPAVGADGGGSVDAPSGAPPSPAVPPAADPAQPAPADLLGDPRLEQYNFKDPSALVDSFVSAQDMLSRSVRMYGPDASQADRDAQIAKFREHYPEALPAQAPENPQGYQFEEIEGFSAEGDDDTHLASMLHSAGVNNDQANAIRKGLAERALAVHNEREAALNQEMAALQQEWGSAMERNFKQAQHMMKVLDAAQPGLAARLDEYGASTDPAMMKFLYGLSKRMGEAPARQPGQYAGAMTPAEAAAKIDESQPWRNPDHPANNPMHPQHEEARRERDRLYNIAAGRA